MTTYNETFIQREKQLKKWNRLKKEVLINIQNPNWDFLNDAIWDFSAGSKWQHTMRRLSMDKSNWKGGTDQGKKS
jgi:hypothetical protein